MREMDRERESGYVGGSEGIEEVYIWNTCVQLKKIKIELITVDLVPGR